MDAQTENNILISDLEHDWSVLFDIACQSQNLPLRHPAIKDLSELFLDLNRLSVKRDFPAGPIITPDWV